MRRWRCTSTAVPSSRSRRARTSTSSSRARPPCWRSCRARASTTGCGSVSGVSRSDRAGSASSPCRCCAAAAGPSGAAGRPSRVLEELRVENLLLIERAELRLRAGLNVLTGETGAGKTVLAHALDLLLGGKPRAGIVRPGAAEAYVEGVFELEDSLRSELGERIPADAEELVLARRV